MSFVRHRIAVSKLNARPPPPAQAPVSRGQSSPTTITMDSIERLMAPRPAPPPPPDPEESFVVERVPLSPGTKVILRHSSLAKKPMEDRSDELSRRASTRLSELSREVFAEKCETRHFAVVVPPISAEERARIEERRLRAASALHEAPSYHPAVMPYDEFLEVKKEMLTVRKRPPGWDETIRRQQLAREKREQEKEERERLSGFPPPLPKKKKKKRKQSPPPPPPPMPEQANPFEVAPAPEAQKPGKRTPAVRRK